MAIRTAIWKVGPQPLQLTESSLPNENLLEEMIVANPRLLSDEWMLIGRQELSAAGRLDLLAIAPDGSIILIELKRDRTRRDVVAQVLDYATWVEQLQPEEIAAIYGKFRPGRSLARDFQERFGQELDEDSLNENHQLIVVAGSLDEDAERIVNYLSERDIPINVLCFQVFDNGSELFLSRTWLLDPVHTQRSATARGERQREPWNGEFYSSFGHGDVRSWDEAREYGFICGGGDPWYSRTLQMLSPGDRVWVNVPGTGYVGVGRVIGDAQPASEFKVPTPAGDILFVEVAKRATYHLQHLKDRERCEYFVPIEWLDSVPLDRAVQEVGLFGNQNTVCRPTTPLWRTTVRRLKQAFPNFDHEGAARSSG